MNENIKTRWIDALETGRYNGKDIVQTQQQLRGTTDSGQQAFCCLGVLCEIARTEGVVELVQGVDDSFWYRATGDHSDTSEGVLPKAVQSWAGLEDEGSTVTIKRSEEKGDTTLAELNDEERKSFKRIAKVIRKKL